MSDPFISYRRKPSASLAMLLQEKLANRHRIQVYVDTTRTDSSQVTFPERLMKAIEDAPVFICLLGDGTLESEWVLKEIRRAHELKKRCIRARYRSLAGVISDSARARAEEALHPRLSGELPSAL